MKKNWFIEWLKIQWILSKARFQFFRGIYKIWHLRQPVISIFGGKRISSESEYYQQAYKLASLFAQHDIAILSGGGPGVMQAVNCGAFSVEREKKDGIKRTLGIGIVGVDDKFTNPCAQVIQVSDFFVRKWLLIRFSVGFVVFPGGIGTCNELFELLDLMKLYKLPTFPVVLIGTKYWEPLLTWYLKSGLANDYIPARCADLFVVTDDIEQAFKIMHPRCQH